MSGVKQKGKEKEKEKALGLPQALRGSTNRSVVWKYFGFEMTEDGKGFVSLDQAICMLCRKHINYDSATTTLHRHLSSFHPHVRQKEQQSQPKLVFQAQPYASTDERAEAITAAITRMIARDMLPFSFVEHKGFIELVKVLEPR
jgi:hypothetical protein